MTRLELVEPPPAATQLALVDAPPAPTRLATVPATPPGPSWADSGQIGTVATGPPVVSWATEAGTWDDFQIREPGPAVFDPVTNQWIMPYSALNFNGGSVRVCAALSADGNTWTYHPQNPLSGTGTGVSQKGEDPYITKTLAGQVWRDGTGRAYIYAEEKPGDSTTQRGVVLFRSAANTLNDWVYFGRVLDMSGVVESWDRDDRTSPVVLHDGTQFVMIFEGRNRTDASVNNNGEAGVAYSTDGLSFTVGNGGAPIIARSQVGAWAAGGIVPDDLIKIGSQWILLCHCQAVGAGGSTAFNNIGRWATTAAPGAWVTGSFTEMTGNPLDTTTNTIMYHGMVDGRGWRNIENHTIEPIDVLDL